MSISSAELWVGGTLFIFIALCIAAMLVRNNAAKKDSVGRSEIDTIVTNVSIEPRKNTRKLD